mmetsp:Transcript_95569/g.212559  ORF Transcript_95569/g.212559 Transcript_95569/m.212559 type:complete len:314 (+) Transcript_95569:219-1160(+)
MAEMEEEITGEANQRNMNRSRKDRLMKAAKQGYGPWAEAQPQRPSALIPVDQAPQQWERAQLLKQPRPASLPGGSQDEPDLDGFLARKPPGAAQKKASVGLAAPKLELKISSGTSERTRLASQGARPKAAPRGPLPEADDADEPRHHQAEEKSTEDFERMQAHSTRTAGLFDRSDDEERSASESRERRERPDRDDRRHKQKEEKRKREEWRKKWKDEKKRKGIVDKAPRDDSDKSEEDAEAVESKHRANMWRSLNNNGVTTAKDVTRKPVGQLTDAALDRKIQEAEVSSRGAKLMSEAEVLAKLHKNHRGRGR